MIEWIGLASRPPAPAVQNPTVDELHGRSGAITAGKLGQIDARIVTMDGKAFARSEVSWVHLGRAAIPTTSDNDLRGTFSWSAHQPVPSGTQDWVGSADIVLTDDRKGGVTGTLTGSQLQTLKLSRCHADTYGTISAGLKGTLTQQKIILSVLNGKADWPSRTTCRAGGTAGTGAPVLK
jgi:hypothetical protein